MRPAAARDIVSPELALVDPVLAERRRTALPVLAGPDGCTATERLELPSSAASERRRRAAWLGIVPVLAVAVALLWATLGLRAGVPDAAGRAAVAADSVTVANVPDVTNAKGTRVAGNREPGTDPVPIVRHRGTRAAGSRPAGVAAQPRRRGATSATAHSFSGDPARVTLVWPRVRDAEWYEVRVVRGTRLIFLATSRLPRLPLPKTWRRNGVSVRVRSTDHVFVWPVRAGERDARPVVDGALASDLAPADFRSGS